MLVRVLASAQLAGAQLASAQLAPVQLASVRPSSSSYVSLARRLLARLLPSSPAAGIARRWHAARASSVQLASPAAALEPAPQLLPLRLSSRFFGPGRQ